MIIESECGGQQRSQGDEQQPEREVHPARYQLYRQDVETDYRPEKLLYFISTVMVVALP